MTSCQFSSAIGCTATANPQQVVAKLHYFDLLWTCCTACCTTNPQQSARSSRGRRRQTNVGNFRAPRRQQSPAQLTPPMGGVSLKLFYDGTTREIK